MLPEYDRYFEERFRQLLLPAVGPGSPQLPTQLLTRLFARIPAAWRSDARYFLASNIIEMVLTPYQTVDADRQRSLAGNLALDLAGRDIDRLVVVAEAVAQERGRAYISATSVAVALGRMAPDLQTTALQIWGPENPAGVTGS